MSSTAPVFAVGTRSVTHVDAQRPRVATVILNTNRRRDTLECLSSLARSTYADNHVIVLDNHSTDGSIEAVRAEYPHVELIELVENAGYAGNNNVGIAAALQRGADWVFVLNEDTILDPNCIRHMLDVAQSDPSIGVVGPMVYHHDKPTVIQSAGGLLGANWESIHRGMDETERGQFSKPEGVEWISGCGILVRGDAIKQAGMLDARYFYFWEETEWCIRLGRAGWKVVHVPDAQMWHKGVTTDFQPKPSVTYYASRNRLLTLAKHRAPLRAHMHAWFHFLRTLASWSIRPKWRDRGEHRRALRQGISDFLLRRWGRMRS